MSLVSVIIPVYNGEKTIKQTIESVFQQTLTDWELIVIDDGSQDSTLEIVHSIQDSRLKVFTYPNSGVSASRNRGITQAKGEFISFLDADDLWTPDKLESQLKALQENPQADVAYSWTDWIDESGKFLRPGGHITVNGNAYKQLLVRDFIESGSNPLIRRQALNEVGAFEESLAYGEDWDMWLRLAARYEFVTVTSSQILYRISPKSASFNIWKMEEGSLEIIERAFADAPESLQYLKREVLASRYKYLTFKAVEGNPERQKGLTALRFLWQTIIHEPYMLLRVRVILIVFLKIAIAVLLPSQLAQGLLKAVKKRFGKNHQLTQQNG